MARASVPAALLAGLAAGALLGWWLRGAAGSAPASTSADDAARLSSAPAGRARPDAPRTERPSRRRAGTDPQGRAADEGGGAAAAVARTPSGRAPAPGSGSAAGGGPEPGRPARGGPEEAAAGAAPGSQDAVRREPDPRREARGVVIDAVTQRPVEGARILHTVVEGPHAGAWWGDTSGGDGAFRTRADDLSDGDVRLELRVSKEGYEPVRVPVGAGEYRVELRPRSGPVLPGRVVGLARGADGRPLAGEIEVAGFDEQGNNASQLTAADAGGMFVLEGVPPGTWSFSLARGRPVECTVPEGGEARVEVVAADPAAASGRVVTDIDPAAVRPDDEAARARLDELRRLLAEVGAAADLDAASRERLRRALAQEIQRLVDAQQAARPRREVVVGGLPAEGTSWLRAETRPRRFVRVAAQDGAARFPALALGAYTLVLVVPGRPERTMPLEVVAGDGPQAVEFR